MQSTRKESFGMKRFHRNKVEPLEMKPSACKLELHNNICNHLYIHYINKL